MQNELYGQPAPDARCLHHWRIETPSGPQSHAVCLRCGAERDFQTASGSQWITRAELDAA